MTYDDVEELNCAVEAPLSVAADTEVLEATTVELAKLPVDTEVLWGTEDVLPPSDEDELSGQI